MKFTYNKKAEGKAITCFSDSVESKQQVEMQIREFSFHPILIKENVTIKQINI